MNTYARRKSALVMVASATLGGVLTLCASNTLAQLKEISDAEMSNVTGQAVMAFDSVEVGTTSQTRFTLGSNIETQINFDQVTLGEYENLAASTGADLDIPNMSLGHIDRADSSIVPFEAINPYFEIAENNGELVGFRMGFEEVRGSLSGDFNSYSGNLGLTVVDGAGTEQDTFLLDDSNNQTSNRATQVGVIVTPPAVTQPDPIAELPAGTAVTEDPVFGSDPQMAADLAPPPAPELPPELIVNQLSNFKTLEIGDDSSGTGTTERVKDFFFSFQKEEVQWQSMEGGDVTTAAAGVHFNIPRTLQINMQQFRAGLPRERTEFIDRGTGVF